MSDMRKRPEKIDGVPVPYGNSVEKLREIIDTNKTMRWAAIYALAAHSGADSFPLIKSYVSSSDWCVRRAMISALAIRQYDEGIGSIVNEALADSSEYIVRAACKVISACGIKSARDGIARLLDSKSDQTRIAAYEALESIWLPEDFSLMFKAFQSERSDEARKAAAFILFNKATASEWRALFDIWKSDPVNRHRKWACDLACGFGSKAMLSEIKTLANDVDGHVRMAATRAIDKILSD